MFEFLCAAEHALGRDADGGGGVQFGPKRSDDLWQSRGVVKTRKEDHGVGGTPEGVGEGFGRGETRRAGISMAVQSGGGRQREGWIEHGRTRDPTNRRLRSRRGACNRWQGGNNARFAPSTGILTLPNTESAKKRVRQSVKRRALNNWRKQRVKSQIKAFLGAVHDKDAAGAETEFRKVCSVLDKVASTSAMHKNTASRRKSRLVRHLNELKNAGA